MLGESEHLLNSIPPPIEHYYANAIKFCQKGRILSENGYFAAEIGKIYN
jgi:hypothetical protein